MRVIALSGHKQSGKDTAASVLSQWYGYTPVSFAAALKDLVAQEYGIDRALMDDPAKKEAPLFHLPVIPTDPSTRNIQSQLSDELKSGYWTPRALCILEGSTKRAVNSSYWVRGIISRIIYAPEKKFVITDLRYKSEIDLLKLMIPGIELIRIERPDQQISTTHPSEADLDDYTQFTGTLCNHGSLEDFTQTIRYWMDFRTDRLSPTSNVYHITGGK